MTIKYHTAKLTLTKEILQKLRDEGYKTDVMTCLAVGLLSSFNTREEAENFAAEAEAAGAAPEVSFEAAEGESLNIKSKEENPMVDQLVQAIENQEKEVIS